MVDPIGGGFDRRDEIVARLRQGPGEEARREVGATDPSLTPSRWTLRTIRATFDWLTSYTLPGVWAVLQAAQLNVRRARVQQYSPDPDYVSKVERLEACLKEAARSPTEVVVLFLDEMGYYRWPEPAPDWAASAHDDQLLARRGGPTNRQQRVVGALNALTGQVTYLDNYIVGRQQLIQMYERIAQTYPSSRCIYVVQDNWSVHRHDEVKTALADQPRIEPVWLPTYAPWLNPIEKLWRWLRQDVLKMHRHADDWKTLRQKVNAFLDQFACGSEALLRYVGLRGDGRLARALRVS